MNNSGTFEASMDTVTVALKLEAGFTDIDPCRTKDFFADTNGFKGLPAADLQNFTGILNLKGRD